MSKKAVMTEQLKASIRRGIGDSMADVSNFAVFEARFLSTEPLTKGGIFNKATVSVSTLEKMVASLSTEGSAIPLHVMHNDRVLPVGKVFSAKLNQTPNGHTEIIGQFFIDPTEELLIKKVENSTIDEVSVGILTEHAFCSECNFDYFGPDSTIMNFLDLTCENGHVIGENGVHTRLVGLQGWDELSLVGSGAAHNAKILPRSKQTMSKEVVGKLAANGTSIGALVLTASSKIDEVSDIVKKTQGVDNMSTEYQALLSKFEDKMNVLAQKDLELSATKSEVTKLTAEITELKASVSVKDEQIAALEASKTTDVKAVEAKVEATEKELNAAFDTLMPHVKAALTASGVAENDLPTNLTAMVGMIVEKGLKLHQVVGSAPVTDGGKVDLKAKAQDPRKEAFKLS